MTDAMANTGEHVVPDGASVEGRRALLANSYEPILTNGKVPVSQGWQMGDITEQRLAEQEVLHPSQHNTGLRTGKLVAVDNDVYDPEHAKTVECAMEVVLGTSLLRRIGAKGSITCYRTEAPNRKITIQGIPPGSEERKPKTQVEFLGEGQQFIAYGLHPGTRQPYAWAFAEFSQQPLEVPFLELPAIDASQLVLAAEAVCEALRELGYTELKVSGAPPSDASKSGTTASYPPTTKAIIQNMLACIPPSEPRIPTWIKVAAGLKSANVVDEAGSPDPSFDGLDYFVRWSRGEFS